ncbi:MAG: PspC domain-containing protein [Balneolaceae bacterium]
MEFSSSTFEQSSTIQVSDKDLIESLNSFLDEDQSEKKKNIWNIRTISGIALIMTGFAVLGNRIGSELFGFGLFSGLEMIGAVAPYAGAALLAFVLIMMMGRRQNKEKEKVVMAQNIAARDKLDAFLYADADSTGSKQTRGSGQTLSMAMKQKNKLTRSRDDKWLFGVCGGIASYTGMSSTLVRALFLGAFFLGYGSPLIFYIVLGLIMPKQPIEWLEEFNR